MIWYLNICLSMAGKVMESAPSPAKGVSVPIPGNCKLPYRKKDFEDVIKLEILRWEDYPGLLDGPNAITWSLQQRGPKMRVRGRRCGNGWRKGPGSKECRWPLEAGKGKLRGFLWSLSGEHIHCRHRDLFPVPFGASDFQNSKAMQVYCFKEFGIC